VHQSTTKPPSLGISLPIAHGMSPADLVALAQPPIGPDSTPSASATIPALTHSHWRPRLGHHGEAETYARRALEITASLSGTAHPDTAADSVTLAALLVRQTRYDEAERLLRQALTSFDTVRGVDSYQAAVAAHELGVLLADRGQADEVAALHQRSVAIKRHVLGPGHPEIATTVHNWALLAKPTGQVEQARLLWAEAEATLNTRDATSTDGRPKDGKHE
jgi:tetratricopeptide (TPR) repeat protein